MARRKRSPKVVGSPLLDDTGTSVVETGPVTLEEYLREIHEIGPAEEVPNNQGEKMPSLKELKKRFKTKSAAIRYLGHKGFKTKDIAKHLGILHQHARNVLTTELKRGPNEPFKDVEEAS